MPASSSSGTWSASPIDHCRLVGRSPRRGTTRRVTRSPREADEEPDMDREHVKGAADKAKGAIKDAAGKVTGDKQLQTEGKLDKAKGSAHNAVGDVKDAVRKGKE